METEAFERQQGKIEGSLQWTIFLVREGKSQAGWRQGGSRLKPVKAGTGISGTGRETVSESRPFAQRAVANQRIIWNICTTFVQCIRFQFEQPTCL